MRLLDEKFILDMSTFFNFRPNQLLAYVEMVCNVLSNIFVTLTRSLGFTAWGYLCNGHSSIVLKLPSISPYLTLLGCHCRWLRLEVIANYHLNSPHYHFIYPYGTLTWAKCQNHAKIFHRVLSSHEKVTLNICTNVTHQTNFWPRL